MDQWDGLQASGREINDAIAQLSKRGLGKAGSGREELARSIVQRLNECEEQLQDVFDYIGLMKEGPEKLKLTLKARKFYEDIKLSRKAYRHAQLTAKKEADNSELRMRESLLHGGAAVRSKTRSDEPAYAEQRQLSAAGDATTALRRIAASMESNLDRSALASETLDASSQTLLEVQSEYGVFHRIVDSSRSLIRRLERQDLWDRYQIYLAFSILMLVVSYIIYARTIRRGLSFGWWVVTPLRKAVARLFSAHQTASSLSPSPAASSSTLLSSQQSTMPTCESSSQSRPFGPSLEQADPYIALQM